MVRAHSENAGDAGGKIASENRMQLVRSDSD